MESLSKKIRAQSIQGMLVNWIKVGITVHIGNRMQKVVIKGYFGDWKQYDE